MSPESTEAVPNEDQPAVTDPEANERPPNDRLEAVENHHASTSRDGLPENGATDAGTSQPGTA